MAGRGEWRYGAFGRPCGVTSRPSFVCRAGSTTFIPSSRIEAIFSKSSQRGSRGFPTGEWEPFGSVYREARSTPSRPYSRWRATLGTATPRPTFGGVFSFHDEARGGTESVLRARD